MIACYLGIQTQNLIMIQKSQLLAAFNGITDLILILDADYNIVFANTTFCKFFNIEKPEQITSRKCYDIINNKQTYRKVDKLYE